MNRRERRAQARRMTKGIALNGKDKQKLRRIIANQHLTGEDPFEPAPEAPRSPLWTPPANAAELIRSRLEI